MVCKKNGNKRVYFSKAINKFVLMDLPVFSFVIFVYFWNFRLIVPYELISFVRIFKPINVQKMRAEAFPADKRKLSKNPCTITATSKAKTVTANCFSLLEERRIFLYKVSIREKSAPIKMRKPKMPVSTKTSRYILWKCFPIKYGLKPF